MIHELLPPVDVGHTQELDSLIQSQISWESLPSWVIAQESTSYSF